MPTLKSTWSSFKKLRNVTVTDEYVQFYNTKIAVFDRGVVRFYSGGYRTETTKRHINSICRILGLGVFVYQYRGVWYWQTSQGRMFFDEGMQFLVRGEYCPAPQQYVQLAFDI